jgi:FkbM family methyltransferase
VGRRLDAFVYAAGATAVRTLLRVPALSNGLTWFSRVWLRHARLKHHLVNSDYDAIIDGGANIGEFASVARLARPDVALICVEPHPPSAAILRARGFRVVEAALWNERRRMTLSQPTEASTSCTVTAPPEGLPHWDVDAIRLEDLEIPGTRILVKLDLQGAEMAALDGMGDLWDRCAALHLEVSYGEKGNYESIRRFLAEQGYVEAATLNELEGPHRPLEADKLWVRDSPRRNERD